MNIAASSDGLARLVTGRASELFLPDVRAREDEIRAVVSGRRVLVIGGAGTIGSATLRALARYAPAVLHVVDHNENGLAELVRDLRSDAADLLRCEFHPYPIDFGSPIMGRLLRGNAPYDLVLNFAAIKHVRSEKDVCSVLHMLDTNVVKAARLLRWIAALGHPCRYFCVSTDKAANPVSLMGASKRLMEHVIFSGEIAPGMSAWITSARFANVAFSDGSLLESFLRRLGKRQPLAVPRDTRRYFISIPEAGQICLLAACCGPHRHILVPTLDPSADLRELQTVATAVLQHFNLQPRIYEDETSAKHSVAADVAAGFYPLLLTSLDTSGEKPYEEFVARGEQADAIGMDTLLGIPYSSTSPGATAALVERLERVIDSPDVPVNKEQIVAWISDAVSELCHRETRKTLDQRM